MQPLRFRQIHLDFHTSERIPGIGANFSKSQFQEMLKRGHVNSVTLFAKCHHGMSYHNTKVGLRHPGLDFELLPRQIEACREIDVKCPIYISAGFDEYAAYKWPEWITVGREGKQSNPLHAGWKNLAFDTPYLSYLVEQIEEVVDGYDAADGIFLDIIKAKDNFSPLGLLAMTGHDVDPLDPAQVEAWNWRTLQDYYARTTRASKKGDEARRVFHNSGHIPKGIPEAIQWQSHLEVESLPTGGWGYDHFPLSAKYARTLPYEVLGMTGKFHTTWGEFGGFKRPNALKYECAAMLAFGTKCSIGDQLHPDGALNADTYDLIGEAYAHVEAREAWCEGATPLSDIALVSPEAAMGGSMDFHSYDANSEQGASRALLELHASFDVVDLARDLSGYKVVVLPDTVTLDGEFKSKIEAYLANGGKLLLSSASGLTPDKSEFALDIGLKLVGTSEFDPDYVVPGAQMPTPFVRGPLVIHGGAYNVVAGEGWETIATRRDPYFNRAWNHFCSHQHTPDETDSPYGAAFSNGQIVYFAHSVFTQYRNFGQMLYRDMIQDALAILLPEPNLEVALPSTARASLTDQANKNRAVLHLLFATIVKRGADSSSWGDKKAALEVIDELFPLNDVACTVRLDQPVKSVKLVPENQELPFEIEQHAVSFTVPQVLCHQMVELSLLRCPVTGLASDKWKQFSVGRRTFALVTRNLSPATCHPSTLKNMNPIQIGVAGLGRSGWNIHAKVFAPTARITARI